MTLSNIDLSVVTAAIASFKALPVYPLLGNFPSTLSISQFVVSKENTNDLKGKADLFLSTDFVASFDLPDLFVKPIKPVKPIADEYKGAVKSAYLVALDAWSDSLESFDVEFGATNTAISTLAKAINNDSILEKYSKYQRCMSFLRATVASDPSAFETVEPQTIDQLPTAIKAVILSSISSAFIANPYLKLKGELIAFPDGCNFDSVAGVDAILAFKALDENKGARFEFYGKVVFNQFMQSVYKKCNCWLTVGNICKSFDVDYGSSINTTTIMKSCKLLFPTV